jgi:hypothetical protein
MSSGDENVSGILSKIPYPECQFLVNRTLNGIYLELNLHISIKFAYFTYVGSTQPREYN